MNTMNVLEDTLHRTADADMGTAEWLMTGNLAPQPGSNTVEVTAEKAQDAALRFRGKKVTILNFASGKNPGGGVRRGAKAQEEDLCRCSGLLHTLERMPTFYDRNRGKDAPPEYHNQMIVSTEVPLIRDGSQNLVPPFLVNFISCAAPNMARGLTVRDSAEVFRFRSAEVVHCATRLGTEVLLLGAWGCGVFRNDPVMVAHTWKVALDQYGAGIEHVVHPVFGSAINFAAFKKVYANE